jgi:hypothetical protein
VAGGAGDGRGNRPRVLHELLLGPWVGTTGRVPLGEGLMLSWPPAGGRADAVPGGCL